MRSRFRHALMTILGSIGQVAGAQSSGSPVAVPGMLNADQCRVSAVPRFVEFSMS
jgi:hypothetical protein